MRGTQTIWRAGFATAFVSAIGLISGCDSHSRRPKRSEQPRLQLPPPASAEPSGEGLADEPKGAAPVASAVAQTLRSLHEQKLEITPPDTQQQRLDFGAARLLQASEGRVVFRDSKQGDPLADANIGAVRAVAHGVDGTLFALGASGGVRLEVRAKSPRTFPRAAYLPGSTLFPDLEEPSSFYVYYPGEQQLYQYPFETEAGAFLSITARFPLEGCDHALTLLLDGAFVCHTATGYARKAPRGRRSDFTAPSNRVEPFRLLPAKRLDELFAISRAGEVSHLRLAAGLPELERFRLPAPVFAAASNAEALAFVLVTAPEPGQPRRWTLLVCDFSGKVRFQTELAANSAPAGDDWLQAVVEDKNLAISAFEPLVAVGGGALVTVWDYAQGRQLFAR